VSVVVRVTICVRSGEGEGLKVDYYMRWLDFIDLRRL